MNSIYHEYVLYLCYFFYKQKTAYEMRISDWSSDVCSSDLVTSSRTPGIDENSCSTPSIWTDVTAAPCREARSTRRSALPSVRPKPRSSGTAMMFALRDRKSVVEGTSVSVSVDLGGRCHIINNTHITNITKRYWKQYV